MQKIHLTTTVALGFVICGLLAAPALGAGGAAERAAPGVVVGPRMEGRAVTAGSLRAATSR